MEKFTLICLWCDTQFTSIYETTRYCSRKHKERASVLRRNMRDPDYRYKRQAGEQEKHCGGCGNKFTTRDSKKIYCTRTCQQWFRQQLLRDRDNEYLNARTPSFRRRIYFQSEGKCGICHKPIDLSIKHPDAQSYSIDHIIPRSLGGGHAAQNLQAAHLGCNVAKGNSTTKSSDTYII
jgi:hypothetical protein